MAKVFPLTRGVILEHGVVWVGDGATLLWFEGLRVSSSGWEHVTGCYWIGQIAC